VALSRGRMREQARQQVIEEVGVPEELPCYSELFVDPDGLLWVQTSFPGDSMTAFRVIDGDGASIADVILDQELRVFEVGDDYVLGAYDKPDGEPHVALFRLWRGQ